MSKSFLFEAAAFLPRGGNGEISPRSCIQCTESEFKALVLAHSIDYYPLLPGSLTTIATYENLQKMVERHQRKIGDPAKAVITLVTDGFNNFFFKIEYSHQYHLLTKKTFEHLIPNALRLNHLFIPCYRDSIDTIKVLDLPDSSSQIDFVLITGNSILALPDSLSYEVAGSYTPFIEYMQQLFAKLPRSRFKGLIDEDGRLFLKQVISVKSSF